MNFSCICFKSINLNFKSILLVLLAHIGIHGIEGDLVPIVIIAFAWMFSFWTGYFDKYFQQWNKPLFVLFLPWAVSMPDHPLTGACCRQELSHQLWTRLTPCLHRWLFPLVIGNPVPVSPSPVKLLVMFTGQQPVSQPRKAEVLKFRRS